MSRTCIRTTSAAFIQQAPDPRAGDNAGEADAAGGSDIRIGAGFSRSFFISGIIPSFFGTIRENRMGGIAMERTQAHSSRLNPVPPGTAGPGGNGAPRPSKSTCTTSGTFAVWLDGREVTPEAVLAWKRELARSVQTRHCQREAGGGERPLCLCRLARLSGTVA